MSTRVNLIPWREMRRQEQNRRLFSISVGAWILMGLIVGYAHWYFSQTIDQQNARNGYLEKEIAVLDQEIAEIEDLRKRKDDLIARMEVIQQLQRDRSEIVHVFDDLVRKLPKGVFFDGLKKDGKQVTLSGYAQSNARISSLMRNLDSSKWFSNPDLDVINVTPRGESRVSKFTLTVNQTQEKPRNSVQSGGTG